MKSILEEASSFEKAIEKAWNEADKPSEFSVKILDQGEKNFLGFCKTPAIISFMYDGTMPDHQSQGQKRSSNRPTRRNQNTQQNREPRKPAPARQSQPKQTQPKQTPVKAIKPAPEKKPERKIEPAPEWTTDLIAGVQEELRQALQCLEITYKITHSIKNKHLTFEIEQSLLESHDEERAFCANLSFLLLQSLKRKMRKKLHGFRLAIHTPTTRLPKDEKSDTTQCQ